MATVGVKGLTEQLKVYCDFFCWYAL